jgi:hypothetical protein
MLGPGQELMPPRTQPQRGVPGAQGAGAFQIRVLVVLRLRGRRHRDRGALDRPPFRALNGGAPWVYSPRLVPLRLIRDLSW